MARAIGSCAFHSDVTFGTRGCFRWRNQEIISKHSELWLILEEFSEVLEQLKDLGETKIDGKSSLNAKTKNKKNQTQLPGMVALRVQSHFSTARLNNDVYLRWRP